METEINTRQTLNDWVAAQIKTTNFARGRTGKKASSLMSGGNGNLTINVDEEVELLVNIGIKGAEPGYIVVPQGAELVLFRTQAQASTTPTDIIATVFTSRYQASLRGNGRTSVRRY